MGINYAWERFYTVVRGALLCEKPLPQRLAECYADLHAGTLRLALPADLLQRFDVMVAACTREADPTGERGTWATTTEKMSSAEARKWLEELLSLYEEATRRDALEREKIAREITAVRP
jgi:hypothetical protein